jgi:cytochrome c553
MRMAAVFLVACFPLHTLADARVGEEKAQLCLLCHKEAPDKRFAPVLEGQRVDYLVASIMAFKTGQRKEPSMDANVANLSPADVRDISDYFASQPFPSRNENLEPGKIAAGEKLVGEMKCASCHAPTFHGVGAIPRLAGQKHAYLAWQLEALRDGRRTHPSRMPGLKEGADVDNVASYLASLR